jgi:hypothetical protein
MADTGDSVEGYDVIAAGIWQTVSRTAFRYAARVESGGIAGGESAKNGRIAELRGIGENLITALKTLVSGTSGLGEKDMQRPERGRMERLITSESRTEGVLRRNLRPSECRIRRARAGLAADEGTPP